MLAPTRPTFDQQSRARNTSGDDGRPRAAVVGTTVYVDGDSSCTSSCGGSWATAHQHLQDAIAGAVSGDEIWVATGTYRPDENTANPTGSGAQVANFNLKAGVGVYGGFDGTETSRIHCDGDTGLCTTVGDPCGASGTCVDDRDFGSCVGGSNPGVSCSVSEDCLGGGACKNLTILSGDLNANDPVTPISDEPVACSDDADPACANFGARCVEGSCIRHANTEDNTCNIVVSENATPTTELDGFTISGASTDEAICGNPRGGGIFNGPGSPTLRNLTFRNNWADGAGAGFSGGGNPTFTDCTFTHNAAGNGVAVNIDGSTSVSFTGCTFSFNTGTGFGGGAISLFDSTPTISACTFDNNRVSGEGGAIYFWNLTNGTITDCTFTNNKAEQLAGGAIWGDRGNGTEIRDCQFTGNTSLTGGGAILVGRSNLTIHGTTPGDCTFVSNEGSSGAAITITDSGQDLPGNTYTISNCAFSFNGFHGDVESPVVTAGAGGAIEASGFHGSVNIDGCTFDTNMASNLGGAVSVSGDAPTTANVALAGCSFTSNRVLAGGIMGGALNSWWVQNLKVVDCTFDNNEAPAGGAVGIFGSNPTLDRCRFTGNQGVEGGGAIHNLFNESRITNSVFQGNSADWLGGAIYNSSIGDQTVTNCTFIRNEASVAGAIGSIDTCRGNACANGGTCECDGTCFEQTCVGGEHAGSPCQCDVNCEGSPDGTCPAAVPGACQPVPCAQIKVTNSIFWENTETGGDSGWPGNTQIRVEEPINLPDVIVNHSIVWGDGSWPGGGGINVSNDNPKLYQIDPQNPDAGSDFHLTSDSPCIDSGDNAAAVLFNDVTTASGTVTTILVGDASLYTVDEEIEYNNDGVLRTITDVDAGTNTLTIHPDDALAAPSASGVALNNYGLGDVDGEDRLIDGDLDTTNTVDIGADEWLDSDAGNLLTRAVPGDGMPDWWETLYFGSATGAVPTDDTDGDGLTNAQEFSETFTNPNTPPFHVNGSSGDDAFDGLAATPQGGGVGPKQTIAAALAAASSGDTILIAPLPLRAPYTGLGNKDLVGNISIAFRSTDPMDPVAIDCEGSGRFAEWTAGFVTFEAMSISNGSAAGGSAISVDQAGMRGSNLTLSNNTSTTAGAVDLQRSAGVFANVSFSANAAPTGSDVNMRDSTLLIDAGGVAIPGEMAVAGSWIGGTGPVEVPAGGTIRIAGVNNDNTYFKTDIWGQGDVIVEPAAKLVLGKDESIDLGGTSPLGRNRTKPGSRLLKGKITAQGEITVLGAITNVDGDFKQIKMEDTSNVDGSEVEFLNSAKDHGGRLKRNGGFTNNIVISWRDRYFDLDPDPANQSPLGNRAALSGELARVTVEPMACPTLQRGICPPPQSGAFDLRVGDRECDPVSESCVPGAYEIATSTGFDEFWSPTVFEVLSRGHAAHTNRIGADFRPASPLRTALQPREVAYYGEMSLAPDSVVNTGYTASHK